MGRFSLIGVAVGLSFVVGASGCMPAFARGISGTYVAKGDESAFLIQIVQTDNGQLTGRYEQVTLGADGKIADMNATIAGAIDGSTVAVTIKPSEFLGGSFAVSGTVQGSQLHLTGGGNGTNLTLNLHRSNEAVFHAQVAALTNQASQILAAQVRQDAAQKQVKVEAERLVALQMLNREMAVFSARADTELSKFVPAERSYRTFTERMKGGLARERSIHGDGPASVERGQISVAVNQVAIDANQIHISVQLANQEFDRTVGNLVPRSANAANACASVQVDGSAGAVTGGLESWRSECIHFTQINKEFQQRIVALRAAFSHIENVWTSERRDQNGIVQAAADAVS